jgi:hypothetical protein
MPVTGEDIVIALKSAPFKPFRLHLADQRKVDVLHPELAILSPRRRTLLVYAGTDTDEGQIFDVTLVLSIEPLEDRPEQSRAA